MSDPITLRAETDRRLMGQLRRLFGDLIHERLHDPAVFEVMLNADGVLWEDRAGTGMAPMGTMRGVDAVNAIRTVAGMLNRVVTEERPVLECQLPIRGARFTAVLPPVSPEPMFTIRLMAVEVFSLDDYVRANIMTAAQAMTISAALLADPAWNIMISGGTSSGKTTLANAMLRMVAEAASNDRVLIQQELPELQCLSPNKVLLQTSDSHDLTALGRVSMRLRPDRIVVGEVRGGEALALLKAMNTGHSGTLFTIHANTARSALTRLEQLIAEATPAPKQAEIAEAIHLIVSIAKVRTDDGQTARRVREVVRVDGYENGDYILKPLE